AGCARGGVLSREKVGGSAHDRAQFSIDLTDAAAKGRPFSFRKPWVASSAEIARNDMRPPFGFCRCRCFARATTSGLRSAWLLRPSHLPASRRLRSRAPRNFAPVMALSNSEIALPIGPRWQPHFACAMFASHILRCDNGGQSPIPSPPRSALARGGQSQAPIGGHVNTMTEAKCPQNGDNLRCQQIWADGNSRRFCR